MYSEFIIENAQNIVKRSVNSHTTVVILKFKWTMVGDVIFQ